MTNTEAKMLAKQWVLGNRNRKASLTRKYNLRKASSPNTGRLKMGIRIDIENNPRDYKPAIDDDGGLVFFTGKPIKRILAKQLFTPPKARKEEVMKEATIDRRLAVCKLILKNKDSKLVEQFSKTYEFDINEVHSVELRKRFTTFVKSLSERTQYQLVAQKSDGTELKSKFYDKEEDLASMQQKCEELDEYESTMIVKRVVDTDEDKEIKEDDVDPKELFRLTDMALRQVPNSAAQKDIIDQLNIVREKLGMKKLVEKEVMVDSLIESAIGLTHYVAPGLDARKKSFKEKLRKLGYIKQVTKDEAMSIINIKNELETLNQRLKDAAKNKQRKEVTRLKREIKSLEKKKRKAINAGKEVGEDAVSRAKEKADLKKKHDAEIEREKEEIEDIKAEQLDEKKIAGLVKKADKSGIPYGILKQVYNRGMAAWKTGHRPGTTPQQWAFARVNSFITGGKTRTTADKDLWSKASAAKKKKKSVKEHRVNEDSKMARQSDSQLKDLMKKMRDLEKKDPKKPSTQHMIKRIDKEMKKRKLTEAVFDKRKGYQLIKKLAGKNIEIMLYKIYPAVGKMHDGIIPGKLRIINPNLFQVMNAKGMKGAGLGDKDRLSFRIGDVDKIDKNKIYLKPEYKPPYPKK